MVRKLKHHEQKLLKKVDFIDWKDNGLQENKVMSKFSIRKREEYTYYNKLSREVRLELLFSQSSMQMFSYVSWRAKSRNCPTQIQTNASSHVASSASSTMWGVVPTADTLERVDHVTASSFCRRRLSTMMKTIGMMASVRFLASAGWFLHQMLRLQIRQAADKVEEGHVRVGQQLVTDPAYLVTREQSDLVTWAAGSKIREHVRRYNNEFDDADD